jgi:hypothetical protein
MADCPHCGGEGCAWCKPINPRQAHQLYRKSDPWTSKAAGIDIQKQLNSLQQRVINVARTMGDFTDIELCDKFNAVVDKPRADSTIRTRRKELVDIGLIIDTGSTKVINGKHHKLWCVHEDA